MSTPTPAQLEVLAERLADAEGDIVTSPVVMGFDAFIDESIRFVAERTSPEAYEPMAGIGDFAAWAGAAAGRSGAREFVADQVIAGGCTVNMGDGLATAGFPLTAFAGVGASPHAVFGPFIDKCRAVHPLGMEPGRAIVGEFGDGKLMFLSFSHFAGFTPDHLRQQLADGVFRGACEEAEAIALTSWSVYPYMTECWCYLQDESLVGLTHRPRFFFDLADPASRAPEDLATMVSTLAGFEPLGPVTLSVNGNEANRIARALGLTEADESAEALLALAEAIRARAGIDEVGIHVVKRAVTATRDGHAVVDGPYSAMPVRSVGAGDRFNAGYLAGSVLGFGPEQRLLLASASSGYFVRNAASATLPQLVTFLRQWAEGRLS